MRDVAPLTFNRFVGFARVALRATPYHLPKLRHAVAAAHDALRGKQWSPQSYDELKGAMPLIPSWQRVSYGRRWPKRLQALWSLYEKIRAKHESDAACGNGVSITRKRPLGFGDWLSIVQPDGLPSAFQRYEVFPNLMTAQDYIHMLGPWLGAGERKTIRTLFAAYRDACRYYCEVQA